MARQKQEKQGSVSSDRKLRKAVGHNDPLFTMAEAAERLSSFPGELDEEGLLKFLREEGVLMNDPGGPNHNKPNQKYVDLGYFVVKSAEDAKEEPQQRSPSQAMLDGDWDTYLLDAPIRYSTFLMLGHAAGTDDPRTALNMVLYLDNQANEYLPEFDLKAYYSLRSAVMAHVFSLFGEEARHAKAK